MRLFFLILSVLILFSFKKQNPYTSIEQTKNYVSFKLDGEQYILNNFEKEKINVTPYGNKIYGYQISPENDDKKTYSLTFNLISAIPIVTGKSYTTNGRPVGDSGIQFTVTILNNKTGAPFCNLYKMSNSSGSIEFNKISSGIIEGTFSATATSQDGSTTIPVTDGKFSISTE